MLSHLYTTEMSVCVKKIILFMLHLGYLNAQMKSINGIVAREKNIHGKVSEVMKLWFVKYLCIARCWCSCVLSNSGSLTEACEAEQWQDSLAQWHHHRGEVTVGTQRCHDVLLSGNLDGWTAETAWWETCWWRWNEHKPVRSLTNRSLWKSVFTVWPLHIKL